MLETLKSNRKQFLDLEIHFRNCKELIYVLIEFQFINISVKDLNEMPKTWFIIDFYQIYSQIYINETVYWFSNIVKSIDNCYVID